MTVPARYTLTEAHFKIAELEREKARLQQALAEIRKRCREGHGDDLIAVTADEALAPEAVRALVRLREMLYDATITYSSFCAKCGPMDDADPADPKYLGSPMMTETLPLREVVEKALAGQDRPHRQEWDRRRGEPRTGITGEARPDTPADSPPPRSEYGGYMGGEPWGAPADGQCVDTDLATLRRIIESVRPDAVPAVARVEAELSRLRGLIEGSATDEAILQAAEARCARLTEENASLVQSVNVAVSQSERDAARCARLQQALERVRENAKAWHGPDGLRTGHAHALAVIAQWCDETLAGPDTPADSQEDKT